MTLMPGLTILLSFQRSLLVNHKRTTPITRATLMEVITIILVMWAAIQLFDMVGVIAATLALITGRLLANSYLFIPLSDILKKPMEERKGVRSEF
jgi:hypothetical protein